MNWCSRTSSVLIAVLALAASTAAGTNPETSSVSPPEEARRAAALRLIDFPWQELDYDIVFMPPQRGLRAMITFSKHRIEVYARPGENSQTLAYDIAHELGHAIDVLQNTAESRKRWMETRGIDVSTEWFGCNRCSDYDTPAGDFAETFAFLLLGPGHFRGRIAPPPSGEQIDTLLSFFPKDSIHLQRH